MKPDAYSRSLRMTHAQWVFNLREDARIYAAQGKHAEARYCLNLARDHAAAVIGAGC